MKTINELIDNSQFHEINRKIGQLLGLKEDALFRYSQSTSRSHEHGPLSDLRLNKLDAASPQIIPLRFFLNTLVANEYLFFEEKKLDNGQIEFIITHINPSILQITGMESLPKIENHTHKVTRNDAYDVTFNMSPVMQEMQMLAKVNVTSNQPDQPHVSDDKVTSIIDLISTNINVFFTAKKQLNQLLELSDEEGFQLYCHSSHPQFPYDLRLYISQDDPNLAKIIHLASSLSLKFNDQCLEVKNKNQPVTVVIVKAIKLEKLAHCIMVQNLFTEQRNNYEKLKPGLERVIALLKEKFPDDVVFKSLQSMSGEGKLTCVPHLRSSAHQNCDIDEAYSILHNFENINIVTRKDNQLSFTGRAPYQRFDAQNNNCSILIIRCDDWMSLETQLEAYRTCSLKR